MEDCLFCKIIEGTVPSDKVYEGEKVIGIKDVIPQAPHHYLLISKKHISTITKITPEDVGIIEEMFAAVKQIARERSLEDPGFRIVMNQGKEGGQTVFHLHMHILGGRPMDWPPG